MRAWPAILLLAAAPWLSGCEQCSEPTPWPPLADQPLGARCEASAQCAAGLECLDSTCTVPCPDGSCAGGATCFDRRYCLPACATDADCLLGVTLGACNAFSPDATYCFQRACQADADCRSGAVAGRCAGLSRASGITWNEFCSTGYCVR